MKNKLFNTALVCLTIFVSCLTHAGLITDTVNDSFIDVSTGLEWMDFGVNNNQSYNYVASQVGVGGVYEGWMLASKAQVYTMWGNAYLGLGAAHEDLNFFGPGQFKVDDGIGIDGSVLAANADAMGYNRLVAFGAADERTIGQGWFMGTQGLSFVEVRRHTDRVAIANNSDVAFLSDNYNYTLAVRGEIDDPQASTMLVRSSDNGPVNKVPEPSTLAIFALGMIGLVVRCLKKKNN